LNPVRLLDIAVMTDALEQAQAAVMAVTAASTLTCEPYDRYRHTKQIWKT